MAWSPRKNAPPPSAVTLRDEAATTEAAIAAHEAEVTDITAAIPSLIDDPRIRAEAELALEGHKAQLRLDRRTLEMIHAAIPEAERREEAEAIKLRRDKFNRDSTKLATRLERDWPRLSAELAALLAEVEANNAEHRAISAETTRLKIYGVDFPSAENRVRGKYQNWQYVKALPDAVKIVDLEGREL